MRVSAAIGPDVVALHGVAIAQVKARRLRDRAHGRRISAVSLPV